MNWNKIKAIAKRKFSSIRRDHRMFAFIVLMPALQILLFGFAIGATPSGLEVITVGEHPVIDELQILRILNYLQWIMLMMLEML